MSRCRDVEFQAMRNDRIFSAWPFVLVLAALLCSVNGLADEPAPLHITLIPELRVVDGQGSEARYHYIPAREVAAGQEIYYTVRIVNITEEKIKHAEVVVPVPANTHLVKQSVTGAGAIISYSTDGGHTFASAQDVYDIAGAYQKKPVRVTHIRWQFRHPLASHVVVLARFRVVFD